MDCNEGVKGQPEGLKWKGRNRAITEKSLGTFTTVAMLPPKDPREIQKGVKRSEED